MFQLQLPLQLKFFPVHITVPSSFAFFKRRGCLKRQPIPYLQIVAASLRTQLVSANLFFRVLTTLHLVGNRPSRLPLHR